MPDVDALLGLSGLSAASSVAVCACCVVVGVVLVLVGLVCDADALPAWAIVLSNPTALYSGVVEVLPPRVATMLESRLSCTAVLLKPEFEDCTTGLTYVEGVVVPVAAVPLVLVIVVITLPLIYNW